MNFVLRTSRRRILESHVGGTKEIEYERKYKEKRVSDSIYLYCIRTESCLFPPFNSSRLDF